MALYIILKRRQNKKNRLRWENGKHQLTKTTIMPSTCSMTMTKHTRRQKKFKEKSKMKRKSLFFLFALWRDKKASSNDKSKKNAKSLLEACASYTLIQYNSDCEWFRTVARQPSVFGTLWLWQRSRYCSLVDAFFLVAIFCSSVVCFHYVL